jgi:hypothetical protein
MPQWDLQRLATAASYKQTAMHQFTWTGKHMHAIRMDLITVVVPTVIHVAMVSAAMESLVTNVAAKAKQSVNANS